MDFSRTARNMLVVFIISALSTLLAYVFRILVARHYAVEEYGLLYSLVSFFSFAVLMVELGLSQSVVKKTAELRVKKDDEGIRRLFTSVIVFQLILTLFLASIFYVFADELSLIVFHEPTSIFFKTMLIWFVTIPLNYMLVTHLLSYQKTSIASLVDLVKSAIILIGAIIVIIFGGSYLNLVAVYASVNIFLFIIFFKHVKGYFTAVPRIDTQMLHSTLKYGIFVSFGSIGWMIMTQTDTLVITYFKGAAAVGIYQAALPLASILGFIVVPITYVMFSNVTNLWAKNQRREIAKLYSLLYKYIFIILLPIAFVLSSFSGLIVNLVFGQNYTGAEPVLVVLSFAFLFNGLAVMNQQVLSGIGYAKKVFSSVLWLSILNLVISTIAISYFGILGVAIALLLANVALFIILTRMLNKKIRMQTDKKQLLNTIAASLLFVAIIYMMRLVLNVNVFLEAAICLIVALIVYVITLYYAKVLTKNDMVVFKNILRLNKRK